MILLVDIGNTRTKWASLSSVGYLYGGEATNREVCEGMAPFLGPNPALIYIASVAGERATESFISRCLHCWGIAPVLLHSQGECCGVRNGYAEPHRLGVDRWAALLAAFHLVAGPVVVIDCGTAMTIDVLDREGLHLGGWILPGHKLMMQSLVDGTALVKNELVMRSDDILGNDTSSCLQLGALAAQVGAIERMQREMSDRFDGGTYVITGGDAPMLLPHLTIPIRHVHDLVLRGVAVIAESMGAGTEL